MPELPPMPTKDEIKALLQTTRRASGDRDLAPLAPVIRRINAANGWVPAWTPAQFPERAALIHTEFMEAREALMGEPERIDDELADIVIRCLDTVELLSPGWLSFMLPAVQDRGREAGVAETQLTWLADIRDGVDLAVQAYRKVPDDEEMIAGVRVEIAWVAQRVAGLLRARGTDPVEAVVRVLLGTVGRGVRHGGRRL